MTEEAVRNHLQPPEDYRVSRMRYVPGTEFGGRTIAGTCYVLSGECEFRFSGLDASAIGAGEFWEFPQGSYEFSVRGACDVDLIKVWRLPHTHLGNAS